METMSLHIAIRKAVEQFGIDVLTEGRLVNILLDYGAYSDVPAAKTIIQAILAGGYCQKIIDLGKKERSFFSSIFNSAESTINKPENDEWRNKLQSYAISISKNNGFQQSFVDYVIECIVYGLEWIDIDPEVPISLVQKPVGPQPKKVNNSSTSGTNTNKTHSVSYQNIVASQFLVMNISPKNAEVFVDGEQQFVSNGMMAVELPLGKHDYVVMADSYETQKGTVDVTGNSKLELDVSLKLEQKTVKLTIEAVDSDAEILINGVSYGKGRWEGLVDEGVYEIEGRKHRYYPNQQTVTIQGVAQQTVKIPSLIALCGNLKVNVQPYGSTIIINGQNMGKTPLLVNNIVVGERKLTIQTNEGTEYSTVVDVRENQVTDVNHIIPSLFLDDYSKAHIGDYFYEDGTFSHEEAKGKEVVGIVFSLETSVEEEERGWTHGQIVALDDVDTRFRGEVSWGISNDEIMKYAVDKPNGTFHIRDTGYLMSHLDCVENNPDFQVFLLAAQHKAKLPYGITSGWYLPSIAQWRVMWENLHPKWQKYWRYLRITGTKGIQDYPSSTPYNRRKAWMFGMGYAESYINQAYHEELMTTGWTPIRSVAAF